MAYFYLEKYYKEWVEIDMFCKDPITCAKQKIRDLYKERLPHLNIGDFQTCEEISKKIRRYQALIKRLEDGEILKHKETKDSVVNLVKLDDFYEGKV